MSKSISLLCAALLIILLTACDTSRQEQPAEPSSAEGKTAPAAEGQTEPPDQEPPTPPVRETFEGQPQLSLFPRVASFRPEPESEGFAFWRTYIEHLQRTSGLAPEDEAGGRAWAIKGLKGLDSVGYFSPLAVTPGTTYEIAFSFRGSLPEGGEAGVGILEFDEFLWIGDQFTEELTSRHLTASREGLRLNAGSEAWQQHAFTFTTGERTRMIHLVFFREGEQQREPVFFDNVSVAEVDGASALETQLR